MKKLVFGNGKSSIKCTTVSLYHFILNKDGTRQSTKATNSNSISYQYLISAQFSTTHSLSLTWFWFGLVWFFSNHNFSQFIHSNPLWKFLQGYNFFVLVSFFSTKKDGENACPGSGRGRWLVHRQVRAWNNPRSTHILKFHFIYRVAFIFHICVQKFNLCC